MSSQKIYVLDDPELTASRKRRVVPNRSLDAPGSSHATSPSANRSTGHWTLALRTYGLGPLSLLLWPRGPRRIAWAVGGAVSIAAMASLGLGWNSFESAMETVDQGAVLWMAVVALACLCTGTAWAHAILSLRAAGSWPSRLRRPWAVCMIGLALPGLGLLIAGRRAKAAAGVWFAWLLAAALLIASQWRWIASQARATEGAPVPSTVESALIVAAACALLGIVAWLVQAFDGVRAVSPIARSASGANRAALALLIALFAFGATYRPTSIARELERAASGLHEQGLRFAPIGLYEIASRLDPGSPFPLSHMAHLYDELGRVEEAGHRRALLQERARRFDMALRARPGSNAVNAARTTWHVPLLDTDDTPSSGARPFLSPLLEPYRP